MTRIGGVALDALPKACHLCELGVKPEDVRHVELLCQRHGNALYRLHLGKRSLVLKWFGDPAHSSEIPSYALLKEYGVPTLPVYGHTDNAILLEDLATSPMWRLAEQADVEREETGVAVAQWYLSLHAAGRKLLSDPDRVPSFLKREMDILDAAAILEIGEKLGCSTNPVWVLTADNIERLKRAVQSLPETLNYNDFY